ncbi:uncharacterized protein LOC135964040 [Calliphora vicina]|uniref:uncharacterized protein LOC135964040 n=1 Tax=Calliphora vicina TaxID=7373 RepID=UPI00325BC6B3
MVKTPNIVRTIKTTKGDASYSVYDLLNEVKCRPNIWQVHHIDHSDRTEFNNSWRSIAGILVQHFQQLDEDEQNTITTNLKNVYAKLKCDLMLFIKYKKANDKRYRLFNFGRHMDFVLQDRGLKVHEVFSQEELDEMDLFERRFKQTYVPKRLNNINSELTDPWSFMVNETEEQPFSNNLSEPIPHCNDGTDMGEIAQYNGAYRRQKRKPKDADQAFFDSIKPWLRKMTGAQKLDFKIEFLQSLKKHQEL